jgi:hypothetical protein
MDYQFCASCKNSDIVRSATGKRELWCRKDGRNWKTNPKWKLDCWSPKTSTLKRIDANQ